MKTGFRCEWEGPLLTPASRCNFTVPPPPRQFEEKKSNASGIGACNASARHYLPIPDEAIRGDRLFAEAVRSELSDTRVFRCFPGWAGGWAELVSQSIRGWFFLIICPT
jgi:hypothetical protein